MDLSLSYNLTGGDNDTVTSITNNVDNGRTQSFAYDPLNRITSAATQAISGVDCWGQSFTPDALANLNSIGVTQCSAGTLSVTVDANNHINSSTAFAYDAVGNMTKDGSGTGYSYTFDDENHLTLASGMTGGPYCYVYNGDGLRVAKKSAATSCSSGTVTKLYWRSIAGDALAETDATGSTTNTAYSEYVFFGGRRIASRDGTGAVLYFFADHLGTTRTITTGSGPGQTPGQLCYDADFTPYGQEISYTERLQTTACSPNYKFTGYERDPETGLDYAFARYYSSRLGRFLSTDPLGGSIGDLQSHNAYAYVRNNPQNYIDPSGLGPCSAAKFPSLCGGTVGGTGTGCILDGVLTLCEVVAALLDTGGLGACLDPACLVTTSINPVLGSTTGSYFAIATFGFAVPAYPCTYGDCRVSPPWIEVSLQWTFLFSFPGEQTGSVGGSRGNTSGGPQQPSKTSERLERLKNCALGYYGIDPLSVAGLSSNGAKWGLIAASAGGVPKSVAAKLGLRVITQAGASEYTSILSMLSLASGGGGALRTIANFGSKWAGPIAIASAIIDATAIGICTASD